MHDLQKTMPPNAHFKGKKIAERSQGFTNYQDFRELAALQTVMGIESDNTTYIIDKEVRQAVAGTYLVDMDGLLSLNEIQRLPSRKLAISFNGSTITVDEGDVKVVGRVPLTLS